MRVFKFGGASVKDANGIKNVAQILQHEGTENILVVISAMGKMTNAFEAVVDAYYKKQGKLIDKLNFIEEYHQNILADLFDENHEVYTQINYLFGELSAFMATNTSQDYNFIYDQIVGFGEFISTKIVSAYLTLIGIENNWLDVRDYIKTDSFYRDAKVNWELTENIIKQNINPFKLHITQGFLGGNNEKTTTLGREGSDYTAGIFAYCLNAKSVTIWKDVAGVLNADPRIFDVTTLLTQISYEETIEMAFYGASVIHPKTIKPLQNKEIPLFVRSFIDSKKQGTKVSKEKVLIPYIPCFIVKKNQILVSISALDFSFMIENNISHIFKKLYDYQLKVNLIQNSAISFSVCVDNKFGKFDAFYNELKNTYKVDFQKDIDLFTIRHFDSTALQSIRKKGKALLTQINKETAQIIIQSI